MPNFLSNIGSSIMGGINNLFSGGGGGGNLGTGNQINGNMARGMNFGNMFQQHPLATGLGLMFGASKLGGSPKQYQMPQEYTNFMNNSGASKIANQPFQQLNDQEMGYILNPLKARQAQDYNDFIGKMKTAYPGSDYQSNSDWKRLEDTFKQQQDQELTNASAAYTRSVYNDYANQQIASSQAQWPAVQEAINRNFVDYQRKVQQDQYLKQLLMQMGQAGAFNSLFPGIIS